MGLVIAVGQLVDQGSFGHIDGNQNQGRRQ
jgi:hypothetical protein